MLRHFIALYEESPSSVISRQDERLGETVRMLERNVCYLVEVLHLKAQLFGLHVEDFVRSDRVGRETKKVADIFVSALVERKHALESAEVPSTITRADLDRLLQLQEGLARLFIQEAQIREGANFKVQAWIDRSETNHREQVCKLREFLELEQKLPADLRLGKYQTSLYKSRLWGLEKIGDLGM
ncbi:hypothetical protein BKA66DRAFT_570524 [Pyrenochaeta sp. MPI-SDFR-AT-0127]|nr:hypothetical protein BKA66DRAFT_570524 [Pyrenochaeta sp. MPI-SDFR-AT-0127]